MSERIVELVLANRERRGATAPPPNLALLREHDRYLAEHYVELRAARERLPRHGWAAMMLTPRLDVCRSVLAGLRVRAGGLDAFVLRRALRGGPLPDPEAFVRVTGGMLDAIAEAGPFGKRGR